MMKPDLTYVRPFFLGMVCVLVLMPCLNATALDGNSQSFIETFERTLSETKESASSVRQRLGLRRVIRDAEQQLEERDAPHEKYQLLEFLFRARQQLLGLDDDPEYRQALLETCRELVKAPDEFAELRLEADLLISQVELAKKGGGEEARATALLSFAERYLNTPASARALRLMVVMALEFGDEPLINDLQEMIDRNVAADPEMIAFQREMLGGDVFAAPFAGTFKRSDGKTVRYPMDGLGRSLLLVFWSKEDGGVEYVRRFAAASLERKDEMEGRLEIISFNLDDLPDAGESIFREAGAGWQVLHLPGGREHPVYKAYARSDPRNVRVSPTGQAALIMTGSGRERVRIDGTPDCARMLGSAIGRSWTQPRYVGQLSSLMAGDFLVIDPEGGIDPERPPELKALANGAVVPPLKGDASFVPAETLIAIQESFVAPPMRYRLDYAQQGEHYLRAVKLCRDAIGKYPDAPDLWVVRNRLIVALMGLWKTDADLSRFEEAVVEAKAAIADGIPEGCRIIAELCLAREALREPDANTDDLIDAFVAERGGKKATGPVLAAACLLALDVADRSRFDDYRRRVLENHAGHPQMWAFTTFLLDRYHRYWLYQVPWSAGRTYRYRENYFTTRGQPDEVLRHLEVELQTLGGESWQLPRDASGMWTAILFAAPWAKDGAPSPIRTLNSLIEYSEDRPGGDMQVVLAVLSDDRDRVQALIGNEPPGCPIVLVPDGVQNPLVQQLGILSEDQNFNQVLLQPDGRIAATVSGLMDNNRGSKVILNVIEHYDEMAISKLIAQDKLEAARARIITLAPHFDPDALDERGRKLKKPIYSASHLRARARVFAACGELDLALVDAEEVVGQLLSLAGSMSKRFEELDEAEALRDSILEQIKDNEI